MSHKNEQLYFEKPKRLNTIENSKFIQKVNEEHNHDKVLKNVFMRSTEENPYLKEIHSSIQLCSELKEAAKKKFIEEKRRQQLRENNQELKQLEVQLRTAYVKKAVAAQIFEQEALKKIKKAENHQLNLELEKARLQRDEIARQEDEEKRAKSAAFRVDLQEQIAISNANRLKKYEALLKEKQAMEEVLEKLKQEKRKEELDAAEKKRKIQADMEEHKRIQDEFKRAHNLASETENDKITKLLEERELENKKIEEQKIRERLRKEKISEQIGKQIYAVQSEEAKARELLVELLIDERQAKEEVEMRRQLEQQMRDRIAASIQFEEDLKEKQRRKIEEKKQEEEYFRQEMQILAERDKLDQLSNEKRRRKQIEHRRALQKALDEKKRIKAIEMKEFLIEREKELKDAEKEQQLVEEERIRIITEHAPKLVGFLAPGVLRESDRIVIPMPSKNQNKKL